MDNEFKIFNCRFCLEGKQYQDLLDLSKDEDTMEEMMKAAQDLKIDYLDFKDRILPKTVCERCYTAFIKAHKFFSKVKFNQDVLKSEYCYNQVDIKVETGTIVEQTSLVQLSPQPENPEQFHTDLTHSPNENVQTIGEKNNESPLLESPQKSMNDQDSVNDDVNWDVNDDKASSDSDNPGNGWVMIDKKTSMKHKKCHMKYDTMEFFSYAGVPIFEEERESSGSDSSDNSDIVKTNKSWTSYKWSCYHCNEKFKTMEELRSHTKIVHDICFGFSCSDCNNMLMTTFNGFVEHARQHRSWLR